MGALQAKENIWWVGVQDPDLRVSLGRGAHGKSYQQGGQPAR